VTTLLHSSGQWLRGKLYLQPQKNDPQATDQALTYARRYALAAMVGWPPLTKTDDANAASNGKPQPPIRTLDTPPARAQRPAARHWQRGATGYATTGEGIRIASTCAAD